MYSSQTDRILDDVRDTLAEPLVLSEGTVTLRAMPEAPLYAFPDRLARFPLVALQVVDEKPHAFPEVESVRTLSVGVTVAIGFVARLDDMASVGLSSPVEYVRKVAGAIDTRLQGTPDLGGTYMLKTSWLGSAPFSDPEEELRRRGLTAHVTLWEFIFGTEA